MKTSDDDMITAAAAAATASGVARDFQERVGW